MIKESGWFVIGAEKNITCYQMSEVLSAFVTKDSTIDRYDFERLQDLESRLVLIAGQSSENTEKVQEFLHVSLMM